MVQKNVDVEMIAFTATVQGHISLASSDTPDVVTRFIIDYLSAQKLPDGAIIDNVLDYTVIAPSGIFRG